MDVITPALLSVTLGQGGTGTHVVGDTPAMGFNSYDSYDWTMDETQLFASAAAMRDRLSPSGYDTITLDWFWYRDGRQITRTLPRVGTPTNASCQIYMSRGGLVYPDPVCARLDCIEYPSTWVLGCGVTVTPTAKPACKWTGCVPPFVAGAGARSAVSSKH